MVQAFLEAAGGFAIVVVVVLFEFRASMVVSLVPFIAAHPCRSFRGFSWTGLVLKMVLPSLLFPTLKK